VFEVVVDDLVQTQVDGFSHAGRLAFAELRVALELSPWSGEPAHAAYPDSPTRTMAFGPQREGLVGYVIIDRPDRR
jgi:hypothetical protein